VDGALVSSGIIEGDKVGDLECMMDGIQVGFRMFDGTEDGSLDIRIEVGIKVVGIIEGIVVEGVEDGALVFFEDAKVGDLDCMMDGIKVDICLVDGAEDGALDGCLVDGTYDGALDG